MSTINVSSLTFAYEGSWDNILKTPSFSPVTRRGDSRPVGRNGRQNHITAAAERAFARLFAADFRSSNKFSVTLYLSQR